MASGRLMIILRHMSRGTDFHAISQSGRVDPLNVGVSAEDRRTVAGLIATNSFKDSGSVAESVRGHIYRCLFHGTTWPSIHTHWLCSNMPSVLLATPWVNWVGFVPKNTRPTGHLSGGGFRTLGIAKVSRRTPQP